MPEVKTRARPVVTQEMLYDDYTHIHLDRRRFMADLGRIAGGGAAAAAIVPLLQANAAKAAIVAADDTRLSVATVKWPGDGGEMQGYLVKPSDAAGSLPGVIVVHENRGLNEHIRDVARRVALEGFVVLAPDFLSPAGGTPADEDKARDMIGQLDPKVLAGNLVATANYLRKDAGTSGAVGVIGFCWGGGVALRFAVADPELKAAVAYYGMQPKADDVPAIRASLLLQYAGLDDRINAGIPVFEQALKAAGTDYQIFVYEGANHAFNNDTSEARYDKAAADLAWGRTIGFLKAKLAKA